MKIKIITFLSILLLVSCISIKNIETGVINYYNSDYSFLKNNNIELYIDNYPLDKYYIKEHFTIEYTSKIYFTNKTDIPFTFKIMNGNSVNIYEQTSTFCMDTLYKELIKICNIKEAKAIYNLKESFTARSYSNSAPYITNSRKYELSGYLLIKK